jgi:transcriptional regulator with XRE-family HTH domain
MTKIFSYRELRRARLIAGLGVNDASDKLGVHRVTLQRYEKGETSPDTDFLDSAASLYGCKQEAWWVED